MGRWWVAALVLSCWLTVGACASPRPPAATPTSPSLSSSSERAAPLATAPPSPTPVPVGVDLGPIVDGVPTTVDSEPVFRADELTAKIASTDDSTPFLAGGWFHAVDVSRFCPAFHDDLAVDGCYTFALYDDRVGGLPRWIGQGDGLVPANLSSIVERPVVLQVHVHDPRCPAEDWCRHEPVLTSVPWLGPEPTDSAPPREIGSPPATSIDRSQAIDVAAAHANPHATPLERASVRAAPFWSILPAEESSQGDRWVWAIVFDSSFSQPCGDACIGSSGSELIVLDYVTGEFIEAQLPAPSTAP